MKVTLRKTSRHTTMAEYKTNEKVFGKEPVFKEGHLLTNSEWQDSLTWYNRVKGAKEARQYLNEYYDCNEDEDMICLIKTITDDFIPTTAAWNSRLILNGYSLPSDPIKSIDERVSDAAASSSKMAPKETTQNVLSLHERFVNRLNNIIGDIEVIIDNEDWNFNLYDYLQSKEILVQYSIKIVEYYKPLLNELMEAYNGTDPDLKEGYRHLCRAELKNRVNFFRKFIAAGERHIQHNKKERKPRTCKPVTPERLLKTFQYQVENKEYGLKSCEPKRLIGAQEVWLFDSKYNKLTVLKTAAKIGMTVKGTTILGFDEKLSMAKRIGRNTKSILQIVVSGGKIDLRKVMSDIKTDGILFHGRCGESTTILRIF